ncbi:MAG: prolipoprotein diacylglyceryl transferase [Cyclobacteriaceae bacterium]|nr:prolipoprotein diacylglyceryl transferase [Cyclobacteriaceae bacterium]
MISDFIIWNASPEIFNFGSIALRWYGLLFALGFLVSQQILYYMFKKEGKPDKEVDSLTIYMVVATVLGARLGHVFFYQPEIIWQDPLGILLPFQFTPTFRFTGLQGLASHGAAIGILFALWLYARRRKVSYLGVLDRIVILVALTGAFIRLGNYFNSEIIGKPTNSSMGVVFVSHLTDAMTSPDGANTIVESVGIVRNNDMQPLPEGRVPLYVYVFFKQGVTEAQMRNYCTRQLKTYLTSLNEYFEEPSLQPTDFDFTIEKNGALTAKVRTWGIARHPAQLYESISSLLLFLFLFWYWSIKKGATPEGRIFGMFLIILWGLRFSYEFLKEVQVPFETRLPLNMGQFLSIPLFVAGVIILIRSYRRSVDTPAS